MKININHYKKSGRELYHNGGKLYLNTDKIIFKRFKTVFEMDTDEAFCRVLPGEGFWSSVELFSKDQSHTLLVTKRNQAKIVDWFNTK